MLARPSNLHGCGDDLNVLVVEKENQAGQASLVLSAKEALEMDE
jgi:hypothetical protein